MVIKVCLAGATGWTGSELARSIANADDLTIVAAVSRKHAGRDLGDVLREPRLRCPVYSSATEALAHSCDVLVEYTKPDSAKANVLAALERGAHVVIGTSGLTETDYAELDLVARRQQRGVLACGNFALTVVLMQKFAEAAARLIPQWEIIDYAHDDKIDAPSGTARQLAARLSKVRHPEPTVPVDRFVVPAKLEAPRYLECRFTRSVCRVTSSAPKASSACRIRSSRSATTRGTALARTLMGRC
jgi:4-hydroxy-tetrahydrodipicolinate reductase